MGFGMTVFNDDQKAVIKELVRVAEPYLMHQTTVAIAPLIDEIIRLRGLVASSVRNDDIGRVLHEQVQNLIHPIAPLPELTVNALSGSIRDQGNLLGIAFHLHITNPTLPIHFLIDNDDLLDDCQWTGHIIKSVELGWWYEEEDGERIWTDWDEIVDRIHDTTEDELTPEQATELATQRAQRAILIKTKAG